MNVDDISLIVAWLAKGGQDFHRAESKNVPRPFQSEKVLETWKAQAMGVVLSGASHTFQCLHDLSRLHLPHTGDAVDGHALFTWKCQRCAVRVKRENMGEHSCFAHILNQSKLWLLLQWIWNKHDSSKNEPAHKRCGYRRESQGAHPQDDLRIKSPVWNVSAMAILKMKRADTWFARGISDDQRDISSIELFNPSAFVHFFKKQLPPQQPKHVSSDSGGTVLCKHLGNPMDTTPQTCWFNHLMLSFRAKGGQFKESWVETN